MKHRGIIPKHQVLDNEIPKAYKAEIELTNMTYQIILPDDYCRNIADKVIQKWKDYIVSVMSGAAATLPRHLWYQVILQAERQLILLRQSSVRPTISTYAHVYGQHDYSTHPVVPIGMGTLVQDKPHRRNTFVEHCSKGHVLGTSFKHYRAWTMCMTKSKATRVSEKFSTSTSTS